jgi:hypothetical protein
MYFCHTFSIPVCSRVPCKAQRLETVFRYGGTVANTGGADKSLAMPISRYILFDGENISFNASLVIYIYIYIYIYSTNIPPIMIINWLYETQNLLSL